MKIRKLLTALSVGLSSCMIITPLAACGRQEDVVEEEKVGVYLQGASVESGFVDFTKDEYREATIEQNYVGVIQYETIEGKEFGIESIRVDDHVLDENQWSYDDSSKTISIVGAAITGEIIINYHYFKVLEATNLNITASGKRLDGIDWNKISSDELFVKGYDTLRIPTGIAEIAPAAFAYLFDGMSNKIVYLDFSLVKDTLETIGNSAFDNCFAIKSQLNFKNFTKLIRIGSDSFFYCTGISGLTLPSTELTIGSHAFFKDEGISKLVIPNSIETIEDNAFEDCYHLSEIDLTAYDEIPSWLWTSKWIFDEAGKQLKSAENPTVLVNFTINQETEWNDVLCGHQNLPSNWKIRTESATDENVFKYEDDAKTIIKGFRDGLTKAEFDSYTSFVIPDNVTKIANNAFQYKKDFYDTTPKNLVLNNNLKEIGEGAFEYCPWLVGTLSLPPNITRVGKWAFKKCFNLTGDIVIPKSLTELSEQIFAFSGIRSVKFHENITKVGKKLFNCCYKLSTLDFTCFGLGKEPTEDWKEVENPEDGPFYGLNTNGTIVLHEIAATSSIELIWYNFLIARGMKNGISDPRSKQQDVTKWAVHAIDLPDRKFTTEFPQTKYEKAFIMQNVNELVGLKQTYIDKKANYGVLRTPDNTIKILGAAFNDKFKGTTNPYWQIKLNNGLQEIGPDAFAYCSSLLGSLVIPESVSTIGDNAFFTDSSESSDNWKSFAGTLYLPQQIDNIGSNAFRGNCFSNIILPEINNNAWWSSSNNSFTLNPKTTRFIDFTRFVSAPSETTVPFVFPDDSWGMIIVRDSNQKTAVSNYLSSKSAFNWKEQKWRIVSILEQ